MTTTDVDLLAVRDEILRLGAEFERRWNAGTPGMDTIFHQQQGQVAAMAALPALSPEGVRAKAAALVRASWRVNEDPCLALLRSLLADLGIAVSEQDLRVADDAGNVIRVDFARERRGAAAE
ncbi:hypothetical protein [Methylobacterium sp. WSM2598]|uniref:hypothetical protein n=1 Tax=Methylobacterium sp. WSM2598 TaxID=398261 RepID=UPI00036BEAFB|nr:hypothetical protein [Methylobacterium sp. WSM2598]